MIKDLVKVANHLDQLGLSKEADFLDGLILKISETLDDVQYWETGDTDVELTLEEKRTNKTHRRGVGWGMTEDEIGIAKWLMEESPGNWVFIIPDNIKGIEDKVRSEGFRVWLESKGYPEGYRILIVGSSPMGGDYSSPEWVVHDLVGHTIGNKFTELQKAYDIKPNKWISRPDSLELIDRIWGLLPDNLKNVNESGFDRVNDIAAGIAFGKITREQAFQVLESITTDNMDDLVKNLNLLFSSVRAWFSQQDSNYIGVGKNRVNIIYPW